MPIGPGRANVEQMTLFDKMCKVGTGSYSLPLHHQLLAKEPFQQYIISNLGTCTNLANLIKHSPRPGPIVLYEYKR